MGTRGPKAAPAALKLLRGNPGRRAIDLGEGVHPLVAAPAMPKMLAGPARAEWKRITPLLLELGLLTHLDRAPLTMYCQAWGDYVLAVEDLEAKKVVAVAAGRPASSALARVLPSGIERESQASRTVRDCEQRVDRMLSHFGLSPSQRSRVTASREMGDQLGLPGMAADAVTDKLARLRVV